MTIPWPGLWCLFALAAAGTAQEPASRLLEGKVLDVLGDPIPAARVTATVTGSTFGRATADGEGVYRIRVPGSGADLTFAARGKMTEQVAWRGEATPQTRNVVLEDAATLRGTVTDAQSRPAPHAMVIAASRSASATAMTDAAGRYELVVPLRDVAVRAVAANGIVETSVRIWRDTTCDLTLREGRGECFIDVAKLPAGPTQGTLRIFGPDLAAIANGGMVPLRDDATARIVLRETCLVQATVRDHALAPDTHLAEAGQRRLGFVAAAADGTARTTLRGTVRTSTGKPAAGVRIVIRDRSHCDLGHTTADRLGAFRVQIKTPSDGFVRAGMRLSEWLLLDDESTIHDGFAWAPHHASDTAAMDLFVEGTSVLRDAVRSPSGRLMAFAEVVVTDLSNPDRPFTTICTDLGGQFDVGLPSGQHELVVATTDGEACRATLHVVAGRNAIAEWHDVATGTIEGTLRNAAGEPCGGVEVRLDAKDPDFDGHGLGARRTATVRTNRDGQFRCRGIPVGDWWIRAKEGDESLLTEGLVQQGKTVAVDLRLPN